MTDNWGSTSTD